MYTRLVRDGFPPGLARDDAAAARVAGTELGEVVATASEARGYRVEPDGETALETRLLA